MTTISSAYSPYATTQTTLTSALSALKSQTNSSEELPPPPPPGGGPVGPGGPSDAEREEMRTFHEAILAAKESGEFDAEALAEQAPDSIKAFAEEQGIDLTDLVNDLSNMDLPPEPPAMDSGMAAMMSQYQQNSGDEDVVANLIKSLFAVDEQA